MSNAIEVEQSEDKLVIRFIRPEIRNPLSVLVLDEVEEILSGVTDSIKEIVFAGSEDIFASGADLREIGGLDPKESRSFAERGQRLMQKLSDQPQITTARINGFCYGGALDLALACDRRIAAPNATFCHPGAGLGIITGWGGTQRLPRLIGEANALKLFFTAAPINAEEAARIGLIDAIE